MGSKISFSKEEENQLYNLFQINQVQQKQKSEQESNTPPVVMMRMMAPTALAPQPRVMKQNRPVKKQRARKAPQTPTREVYQTVQRR
jgi:hypothetical protein